MKKQLKFTCSVCKSHKGLKLMAEYSSSALWCRNCGVCFMNPKESFPELPPDLIDLIDAWNGYWDYFASEKTKYNYEYHHAVYFRSGKYLEKLINKFYPCKFRDYP